MDFFQQSIQECFCYVLALQQDDDLPADPALGQEHGVMLIYRRTSILEAPAQTRVNTVNCVGVMGKGLAHAFKEREPEMFKAYKRICDRQALEPGKLWLWRGNFGWILNFPTKVHWRDPSKIEWIEQGLEKFVAAYAAQGITEISFPQLGCGNGQLDWNDVGPLMEHYLSKIDIPVYIHVPTAAISTFATASSNEFTPSL